MVQSALVLQTIVRWLGLFSLATLTGCLVVDLAVLPRDGVEVPSVRRRVRRLTVAALATLVVSSAAELVARAQAMSGSALATAITDLPLVIGRTHFGAVWRVRAVALGLLGILCAARVRALRVMALVMAVGVAVTTALAGHAADSGDLTLRALVDCLHVVASSAWTGGLVCLFFAVLRDLRETDAAFVGQVARRFSRLAGICAMTVLFTGAGNTWIELAHVEQLWTTAYGRFLTAKLVAVTGLLALGAANRYVVLPSLPSARGRDRSDRARTGSNPAAVAALSRYIFLEAILAAVV